jgi:peroxiredoxin
MRSVSVFLLIFPFAIKSAIAQHTSTVEVTTRNMADGTRFYLQDSETNRVYDSAFVKDNHFVLKAQLDKDATQVMLYEKSYNAYIFFWLSPGNLRIEQTGKTLRTATVTGSDINAHKIEPDKWTASLEKQLEKLEVPIEKEKNETKQQRLIEQYEALEKQQEQVSRNYVRTYPNRLYSASLLSGFSTTWGADSVRVLYNLMAPEIRQTNFGQKIERYLSVAAPSSVGDMAAEVKQPDTQGDTILLSSFRGKWVLLEFWASWCGPCREENPSLVKTYHSFKDKNFDIFAVSLDKSAADWKKAIEADGLRWTHVSELNLRDNTAALAYGINIIPNNVLIDPTGKIVARDVRGDALRKFLEERL